MHFSTVVTSKYELAAEELKEVELEVDECVGASVAGSGKSSPLPADLAEGGKQKSWLGSKMGRSTGSTKELSSDEKFPSDGPRYLIQVCNTSVVCFDLSKIIAPIGVGMAPTKIKEQSIIAQEGICKQIYSFCDPIVAARGVSYIEDEARFWSSPVLTLSCVDSMSTLSVLSFSGHELHSMCEVNVLEKVSVDVDLKSSIILGNGNIYMLHSDMCIFTATPVDKKFVPVLPTPVRLRTNCVPPLPSQLLLTGIEDGTLSLSKSGGAVGGGVGAEPKIRKRRTSIMDMVSAPVELDKLFAKTRAELQKSELLSNARDTDPDTNTQSDTVKATIAQTAHVMDETRAAFEERGEKLLRIAKRSQALSEGAGQFRENARARRLKLQQQKNSLGGF